MTDLFHRMRIVWSKGKWYNRDHDLRHKLTMLVARSKQAKDHAEQGATLGTILYVPFVL